MTEMGLVLYLCTTADIWSAHNRSFFGTTVHWIDPAELTRKSAVLACSRFRGKHSYDAIAALLEQVHMKYNINQKVLLTLTDNGSNFLKAFREFSCDATDVVDGREARDNSLGTAEGANGAELSKDDIVFTDMQAAMQRSDTSPDVEYSLPPHRSCASHTLNLIAGHDSMTANDPSYKRLYYSTMAKCSALWNKASRSVQSAEIVKEELQTSLIVPNSTRWNSHYDAVDKIRAVK